MKKYGLVILLVIFCRSAFAGCEFNANTTNFIFTPVNIQPISLTNNTNEPQLVATYSTNGSPALTTRYNEDYHSDMNVWTSSSIKPLTTKTSTGAVLFPINLGGWSATASGYAFAFKISSGSRSAYITDISNITQPLFPDMEKSECDNKTWDITLELWHVNSYLRDEKKYSEITPLSDVYFRLQFTGDYDNSDAYISLSSFSIPVTPVTCNLSVNSSIIDFGKMSSYQPSRWPTQTVTLTSDNCSQVGGTELHILANGNPTTQDQKALLNKLTGDDAAENVGLSFYRLSNPDQSIRIDLNDTPYYGIIYSGISSCDATSFDSSGFISSCTHTILAKMVGVNSYHVATKGGNFEASATFSVNYY